MIELTEQQREALETSSVPPRLVDPQTHKAYVLIGADVYERMQLVLEQIDPSFYEFEEIDMAVSLRDG